MPETRYNQEVTYPEGLSAEDKILENAVIAYIPHEVSDEELYQEQLTQEFNDAHTVALLALEHWDNLTLAQKDKILKGLVKWALWKDGWLKLE